MPLFHVTRREIWYATFAMNAKTADEAIALMQDFAEGDQVSLEFSHVDDSADSAELAPKHRKADAR